MNPSRAALVATLCVVAFASAASGQPTRPGVGGTRIVAIGDVHGSYEGFSGILETAGLTDARQRWVGGHTILVQTGDIFDRGTGVRQALDLLMRLERDARRAGGRVEPLLGNHEVVNILGDFRDVSPAAFASFADRRSESRRTRAYDDLVTSTTRRGQQGTLAPRDTWMAAHPPGFIEYNAAIAPDGHYGRWLRTHKVVVAIGKTAFMHAGIRTDLPGGLADVNRIVAEDIAAWDATKGAMVRAQLIPAFATMKETIAAATAEIERIDVATKARTPLGKHVSHSFVADLRRTAAVEQSSLLIENGPMWFRGFAKWPETEEPQFTALLARLGLTRFVAGHTPMPTRRIMNRWGYRIFQIDTGMLGGQAFEGGRASALELVGDRVTAIYTDRRDVVIAGRADSGTIGVAAWAFRRGSPPRD